MAAQLEAAMREDEAPILVASFDPKLKIYLFLQASLLLCITVIGLVLLPVSLAVAWWWATHYFATIRCHVTRRRLYYQHGILFQRESAVPLDKIQDMALLKGPVLTMLGLSSLRVETAGGSGQMGGIGGVKLSGLRDAKAFQEKVLRLRDAEGREATAPAAAPPDQTSLQVLMDIRDSLRRIEERLRPGG